MIEELPPIDSSQIVQQEEMLRQRIEAGTINQWMAEQLDYLAQNNPILYEYVMDHAKKLAFGVAMMDPRSIAMSVALEHILLLTLVGSSIKGKKELNDFVKIWGKFFPGGFPNFGKNNKE